MKLTLESTPVIAEINGAPARMWKGRTARGLEVTVYVAMIQVDADADASELERELREVEHPSGVCRSCGCNDNDACPGGCAWTDETHTLCTGCV